MASISGTFWRAIVGPQQRDELVEKRDNPRKRTFKGGKIVFNHERSVIDCTVKNLSQGGAALSVESTIGIPDEFKLIISSENVSKTCRVVWRTDVQIGVAFTKT